MICDLYLWFDLWSAHHCWCAFKAVSSSNNLI